MAGKRVHYHIQAFNHGSTARVRWRSTERKFAGMPWIRGHIEQSRETIRICLHSPSLAKLLNLVRRPPQARQALSLAHRSPSWACKSAATLQTREGRKRRRAVMLMRRSICIKWKTSSATAWGVAVGICGFSSSPCVHLPPCLTLISHTTRANAGTMKRVDVSCQNDVSPPGTLTPGDLQDAEYAPTDLLCQQDNGFGPSQQRIQMTQ